MIEYEYYPNGKKKALTMSYDDGNIYDRRLVEIFNRYGIKGTFHINSGLLDKDHTLKCNEINELFKGHEVSAHTSRHPFLTMIPREAMIKEIIDDRGKLENLVGYPVRGMSFPFGDYNEDVLNTISCLGIEYSRTVLAHFDFRLPENFLTWHPTCHHEQNLLEKCAEFMNVGPFVRMPLFYVWGHSYEFDRNNNWELIEEFCKMISGDDDVWFATNIEIMDYLTALRSLKFSIDNSMVINPASISVWISVDGEPVEIKPGMQKIT